MSTHSTHARGMIAQGDVLLLPWDGALPADAVEEPADPRHRGHVLAYGEATGSAHALDTGTCRVLAPTATTPRLLVTEELDAILRHVKHPPQTVPARTVWEVRLQVEEAEGGALRVTD